MIIDGTSILSSGTSRAIVDSGTSMITVPADSYRSFKKYLDD